MHLPAMSLNSQVFLSHNPFSNVQSSQKQQEHTPMLRAPKLFLLKGKLLVSINLLSMKECAKGDSSVGKK